MKPELDSIPIDDKTARSCEESVFDVPSADGFAEGEIEISGCL
jgi:hypothetical protein